MGARSRKRKRSGTVAATDVERQPADGERPADDERQPADGERPADDERQTADGERPADDERQPADEQPPPGDGMRRGYARGRARDEEIRAKLEPLAPGERPRVVTIAAIVAFVFAIANVATALSGNDISSASGDPGIATAVTTALLLVTGFGMLARQYWAVLGFQTILGLQIVLFSLYLIGVQKLSQATIPLIAIGLLGWLFWKLVHAMARLQMPDRPSRRPAR